MEIQGGDVSTNWPLERDLGVWVEMLAAHVATDRMRVELGKERVELGKETE